MNNNTLGVILFCFIFGSILGLAGFLSYQWDSAWPLLLILFVFFVNVEINKEDKS